MSAAPGARPASEATLQRVRDEQVAELHRFPTRLFGNLINAGMVAGVLWGDLSTAIVAPWLAMVGMITLVRFRHCWVVRRRATHPAATARFVHWFMAGSWATGALWGAASFIVWLSPQIAHHVLIAFAVAGTSAAASFMSHAHLPSAFGFLILAVGPLAANFFLVGESIHFIMAVMALLFLVLMIVQSRHSNRQQRESLLLKEAVNELVSDLSMSRDNLEGKVRARTAELAATNASLTAEMKARAEAETRFRQAQKMEAVGQLTGGIAHDFNNLLSVILGNLDLASLATKDNPSLALLVRRAQEAAERGASLVQRLLAFSRRQTLVPQVTDLNALTTGMLELFARSLGSTIQVSTRLDPMLWRSSIDPGQLESALLNLAINARDAMPEGGVLTIATRNLTIGAAEAALQAELQPGDYAQIAVTDTGIGMKREVLEHALEPFFTTKSVGKGSGLGLSMVFGFVKQSGGHLNILSEVGLGTTIEIYLPRAVERASASGTEPPHRLAG